MAEKIKLTEIRCPKCGAPARFDILKQKYLCGYCGSEVGIAESLRQKQGFRKMQGEKLRQEVSAFRLVKASCSGCGASLVFEEGEALSTCSFCGKSLVRSEYLDIEGLPESIIPFAVTEEDARRQLKKWCDENGQKEEAKHLQPLLKDLKGFYLPYELVRGPVHMTVSRMTGQNRFPCEGFISDEFVNRSKQLDNLLLDGMEPFDEEGMRPFEFAFVAGHRVKISDISDKALEERVREETAESCTPAVRKTLEAKAIEVQADVSGAVRLPVLLPVYYIQKGNVMAAVNGQTGKVSVRAEKESHYHFLPWWLKAILGTLIPALVLFGALTLFRMAFQDRLLITMALAFTLLVVMLCLFSDTPKQRFSVEHGRRIFTSGGDGLTRNMVSPVFTWNIDGVPQPVKLRFTTPGRILKITVLSFIALFLPVLIALFLNGFDFQRLDLGGSAVWFCIMVPVVPVYLAKYGVIRFFEEPWIYQIGKNGALKRWKKKAAGKPDREFLKILLRGLIVPPASLGVWFAILCFAMMCYLTAFGFGD